MDVNGLPSGVASIRRTSRTSSFFLIAEMLVKFGENICLGPAGLDTGVLALKLGLIAELCVCFNSSFILIGVDLGNSTSALIWLRSPF